MAIINVPGQSILAGVEKDSPSTNAPSDLLAVKVRLTDPDGSWGSTAGNVVTWGVQIDRGDGAGFVYLVFANGIPFGTRERDGGLPSVAISGDQLVVATGRPVRLAVLTDAAIVLGAVVTTTP